MADTRMGEAIDAVVTTARAVLLDPIVVYDGPAVSGDFAKQAVFIGYDGNPEGEFQAARTEQAPTGPGSRVRDERVVITCAAVAWSGDTDTKTLRDTCLVLFATLNAALRANPSQGVTNPAAFDLFEGDLHQELTSSGLQVRLPFTITAQVRI